MSAAEAQLEALFQNKSREVQAVRTSLNEEKLRLAAEIAAAEGGDGEKEPLVGEKKV